MNIALETILAKLPIMEIKTTIQSHTEPLMKMLPDRRMKKVLESFEPRIIRVDSREFVDEKAQFMPAHSIITRLNRLTHSVHPPLSQLRHHGIAVTLFNEHC